jgi:hypothetical protein
MKRGEFNMLLANALIILAMLVMVHWGMKEE